MRRPLLGLLVSVVACAPRAPAAAAAGPTPRPLAEETRSVLDRLVAADTSHGHETDALRPIEQALRAAGLAVDLVESAPGRGNLIARYRGNGAKRPLLLLAHVDVVPVESQNWSVPPFAVTEKDGFLWGRGVNDDKGMAAVVVAIALEAARSRPALSRDLVFALTAGEETGGQAGVRWLTANRRALLDAELALNEGGVERIDDDGERVLEIGVGVAEKTFQSYKVVVRGKGGHSSIPPTDSDPVLVLSRALVKIGEFRFPARVIAATREELAADANFQPSPLGEAEARVAASGRVTDEDERILSKDRIVNALLRTTCVTTQLQGSPQDNVLPTSAEATVNCRILPDETREQTLEMLRRVVADLSVEIMPASESGYGPYSPVDGEVPGAVRRVVGALWPSVPVVPIMGTGATDSRYLRAIGIQAYGVGVSMLSQREAVAGRGAHGPDERLPAKWLESGARYLHDLVYELAR